MNAPLRISAWLAAALHVTTLASAAPTSTVAAELETAPAPEPAAGMVDDLTELDLEALLGTVVSASRTEESRIRAPATVTILDSDRIQLSGARSLPELLRLVPGVHVMTTAQGNWVVSLRGSGGLQSNNLVVLLDGFPLNSILDASIDWTAIPVDIREIERIEIVRGPVSTIHGPNAYTGVIALFTKTHAETGPRATSVGGVLRGGYGDGPTGSAFGFVRGQVEQVRYQASALAAARAIGAEPPDKSPDLERVAARLHVERPLGEASSVEATFAFARSERDTLDHLVIVPQGLASNSGLADLRLEIGQLGGVFDSVQFWGRGQLFRTRAEEPQSQSFSYAGVNARAGTLGVDLRLRFTEDITVQVGATAGGVQVDAPFMHPEENDRFRETYGFHTNATATVLEAMTLNFGVRGEVSAMTQNPQFAFRASATYVAEALSLRLSAGSAYRHPTVIEVGSRLIDPRTGLILLEGNPELSVPRLNSIELGAIIAVNRALTVTPTVFLERLDSLMVTDFESLVRKTFVNAAEARLIAGGELEVEWRIDDWITSTYAVATLREVSGETETGATVGAAENNPVLTASGSLRGHLLEGRFGFGADAAFVSGRDYNVRTGIPPELISADLSAFVQLTAALEYRLLETHPFWVMIKFDTRLPGAESPFPIASTRQTEALLSLEWRPH